MTSSVLPLSLGAGGGLALWYLTRGGARAKGEPDAPMTPSSVAGAGPQAAPTTPASPPAPCRLHLSAAGLSIDGVPFTIPSAVARCKASGQAEVIVARDAPGVVFLELAQSLIREGIRVNTHRNGAAMRRQSGRSREPIPSVDLDDFADTVAAVAADIDASPTPDGLARGRFGARKVFLGPVRRALRETKYKALRRATIDALLIEAMRDGLLQLARAELVAAMDPDEVRDSEIRIPNATYHFVISEPSEVRNATTYRHFTVRSYPKELDGNVALRWFRAEPPVTWAVARDRLVAAGVLDPALGGRTYQAGWMLSVDPHDYRDDKAEVLP